MKLYPGQDRTGPPKIAMDAKGETSGDTTAEPISSCRTPNLQAIQTYAYAGQVPRAVGLHGKGAANAATGKVPSPTDTRLTRIIPSHPFFLTVVLAAGALAPIACPCRCPRLRRAEPTRSSAASLRSTTSSFPSTIRNCASTGSPTTSLAKAVMAWQCSSLRPTVLT